MVYRYNPFRYRGYYYDIETGLYYLNSRYYNPEWGRFLNADACLYSSMLGFNLFAYCENNPVNYIDPYGESGLAAALAGWASSAWGLALVDGPLPVGDIIYVVGCVALGACVVIEGIAIGETINDAVEGFSTVRPTYPNIVSVDEVQTPTDTPPVVHPGEKPQEKDGYIPSKEGPVEGKTKDGKKGWKDKNGNIWVPVPTGSPEAHGGGHWDVQSPKGGYTNVYPGGKIRGGKAPFPKLPIFRS